MAAYNGWRLQGEARGGHIPGAVAFPREWLSRFGEAEVGRLLDEKGIHTDRTIVTKFEANSQARETFTGTVVP